MEQQASILIIFSLVSTMVLLARHWQFEMAEQAQRPGFFRFWLLGLVNFTRTMCFKDTLTFRQAYPSLFHAQAN